MDTASFVFQDKTITQAFAQNPLNYAAGIFQGLLSLHSNLILYPPALILQYQDLGRRLGTHRWQFAAELF
jgi:hypothetical protein